MMTRPRRRLLYRIVYGALWVLALILLLAPNSYQWTSYGPGASVGRAEWRIGAIEFLVINYEGVDPGRAAVSGVSYSNKWQWKYGGVLSTAAILTGATAVLLLAYRIAVAKALPESRCDECGYDLRDVSAHLCPECGTVRTRRHLESPRDVAGQLHANATGSERPDPTV